MRALTLSQPWAGLVASGIKRVENRPRKMIAKEQFGKRFAIHASREIDAGVYGRIAEIDEAICKEPSAWYKLSRITSAVIAVATLWDLILKTPQLDWLLLTKRPENFERLLAWGRFGAFAEPFRNVWLGVTAEDDEHARRRIPILQATSAAVRFVSYEPALGPIDWVPHLSTSPNIHWVIFGDESGRGRRDANIEWARATRDACATYGVAFHFKQWCGAPHAGLEGKVDKKRIHLPILDGSRHAAFPEVRR